MNSYEKRRYSPACVGYHAHGHDGQIASGPSSVVSCFRNPMHFFPRAQIWGMEVRQRRLPARPAPRSRTSAEVPPTPYGPRPRTFRGLYLTSAFEVFHRYYSSTGFVRCRTRWVDRRRLHNPALTVARLSSVLARLSSDLGVQTQMRSQAAPRHSHESGCESPRLDELAVSRELNPITTRRRRVKRC